MVDDLPGTSQQRMSATITKARMLGSDAAQLTDEFIVRRYSCFVACAGTCDVH